MCVDLHLAAGWRMDCKGRGWRLAEQLGDYCLCQGPHETAARGVDMRGQIPEIF